MSQQVEELAQFVATTRWTDVPAPVQHRLKLIVLDTIGVMLAGSVRPEVAGLRARLTASGGQGATVIAPGFAATDPRTAALLNAIAARSVEMCEGMLGLQSAVHILPTVLALGEQRGSSGVQMLEAFLAGYEAAGRLVKGFTPRAFAHPNGQISLLGAVAAGARLLGLDGPTTSLAMRISTTMLMTPSYTNTAAGGTTLNLPAAMGAVAGTLAPEMALAGYFAKPDAIEEALGRMVGTGFDPTHLADHLGETWVIPDGYFRFYACCNPIHPALDSLADALSALHPTPAEIERIDVQTFAFASVMNNPEPPNYFASKYSLPHAAAVLAVRGGLGFADIDDTALDDPAIAAIRPLVHISEDPAMTARGPVLRPASVTVTLKDGRRATAGCEQSKRDTFKPDPEPGIRTKFHQLAAEVLTPASTAAVEGAIDRAETWSSIQSLLTPLKQTS